MIRQPSSYDQLHAWHGAVMAGEDVPRHDSDPHCGWYKTRLVKGGPWVPAQITCDQDIDPVTGELRSDERLVLIIQGEVRNEDPAKRWSYMRPISQDEFRELARARLSKSAPDAQKPIDLSKTPTPPKGI